MNVPRGAGSGTDATLDLAAKKAVLRKLTYGLYGVTVSAAGEVNAFTANWVTQVSFEPPLVAVSVENDSHSIGLIRAGGVFAVNVYDGGSRELAGWLGKRWSKVPDKLARVPYRLGATGCPVLLDALGVVECRVVGSLPAGDSTLVVGEVVRAEVLREGGAPLTMAAAGFRHSG